MTVRYIQQEHKCGCVLASIAMVTGKTYRQIHDLIAAEAWRYNTDGNGFWERVDFNLHGMILDDGYRWLEARGYATQLRYKYLWGNTEQKQNPWPPQPFAPVHIVDVLTPNDTQHAIVMDAQGKLFDPSRPPESWPETLDYYQDIYQVCGIWQVQQKVFVFGSNLEGIHGSGAAKEARIHHGAIYGVGVGFRGQSYALPTKETPYKSLPLGEIKECVQQFQEFAANHPELLFEVTRIGCGLAGFKDGQIAPLFVDAPSNCLFDTAWREWLPKAKFWGSYSG